VERVRPRDVRHRDADAPAVADDRPRPAGGDQLVHRPGHARPEVLPRLAGRRLARPAAPVGQLLPLGVDLRGHAAAPFADVDLAPALVEAARAQAQQLGGLARAAEVAAHDALVRQAVEDRCEGERLLAPAVRERRVELALEALLGVPGGLPVADEDQAVAR
jgi:hypothetical protein